ncbi:suppressor of loss of ypt1 [Tulasnella sp. 424]|nr:suppressor of loss of ypt1 [Tulasnella sp. 424]KAG8974915.1 suppressor of loss of ypt1 [Tulasnella sp. 425]
MFSEKQNGFANTESRWWPNGHNVTPWSSIHKPGETPPVSPKWKAAGVAGDLPRPATADHHHSMLRSAIHLLSSSLGMKSPARPGLQTSPSSAPSSSSSSSTLFNMNMLRFVSLCMLWYASSALSSNTGKQIMNQFRYPVTLTFVQFGFVSGYCLLFANPWYGFTKLRRPTTAIMRNTLPMAVFQVGGHIFSSMAISRVPVSTVHTIKALSPLFTVGAYALLFGVRYSARTYISLLPLTLGVMLACSFDLTLSNALGLICAFGSAIVFVTSNIFFKKIMPSQPAGGSSVTPSHKLDKLNLLFYSSGLAFLLMIPIWAWSDLGRLLDHDHHPPARHGPAPTHGVPYYFFLNGTVHWAQNIIAFAILSSTSPVTYSIASLIKRIVVILMAIAWFRQTVHPIQAFGIGLTFVGLYMYNNAKADVDRGENRMRRVEARMALTLPTSRGEARDLDATPIPSPVPNEAEWAKAGMPSYSMSSALQAQNGVVPVRPQHDRKSSLVPVSLMAPPPSNPRTTNTTGGQRHPVAPLRLDTSHRIPTRSYHHGSKVPGQPMSPTDSYPSPPASQDSPPQSAIPAFALASATSSVPPTSASNMFSHRRPTVYESSSISGLDGLGPNGEMKDMNGIVDGAGAMGVHVPIATAS